MMKMVFTRKIFLLALGLVIIGGCSHSFDSNVLDLSFYQWNFWQDVDATLDDGSPSCGWEALHRGTGKLVRIPALAEEYFPGESAAKVYWYHCRFTLPEDWEDREVTLNFEDVGPATQVFLNQDQVGSHLGEEGVFEIEVTDVIFYTRDNHLAVRIVSSDQGRGGIGGTITISSENPGGETPQ